MQPLPSAYVVRFDAFELDLRARELRLNGKSTGLPEQSIKTLAMLLDHAGEVVLREEIRKELWPNDTAVEFDHGINAVIGRLRQALGDSANDPHFIETLARRGYRWIAPIERSEPSLAISADGNIADSQFELRQEASNLVGKKISHYRVLEVIGGGGMGVVYRAEDLKLGRSVALKFLPEELGSDPNSLERFEREARAASALDHPNICSIYEFAEHEGQPFIVMQLLEGQTLRDCLADAQDPEQTLALNQLLDIAIQVTQGLEAAHEKGIVHRDIKPANIFITTKGVAKILDFGVAKLTSIADEATETLSRPKSRADHMTSTRSAESDELGTPAAARPAAIDRTLTRTGMALGTAGYMSPEQVRGEKLDARTDLFSFGLVLYEMATGERAFSGETAAILHDAILNRMPVPAHDLNSTLPATLEQIISKALKKDRESRYQSAKEMGAELRFVMANNSLQSMKGRKKLRFLGACATVLAGLLATAFVIRTDRHRPSVAELKQTQLTANSADNPVEDGAISPDGRYLAYHDIRGFHIKLVGTNEVQTVPYPDLQDTVDWTIFSFTETRFLAWGCTYGGSTSVWTLPVIGGQMTKVRDDVGPPAVSPDGSMIAFLANRGTTGYRDIWVTDSNGQHARKIYGGDQSTNLILEDWLPSGRRIIYQKSYKKADKLEMSLESIDLKGGSPTQLLSDQKLWLFKPLLDGRLLYMLTESDISGRTCNLWEIQVDSETGEPRGKPFPLTNWSGICAGGDLSATRDGRLVTNKWWVQDSIYTSDFVANSPRKGNARRLTLSDGQERPIGWTADSKKIVFLSNRDGSWGIYKQAPGEEAAEQIVTGIENRVHARLSPDGEWVLYEVFTGWTAGEIWRVPIAGGSPALILTLRTPSEPAPAEWPLETDLHEPPRCAKAPARICAVSERTPDGKELAFTSFDPLKGRGPELTRISINPSAAYKWDISPDATRIAVLERSKGMIEIISLIGRPRLQITVKGWNRFETLNWAADGEGLFLSSPRKGSSVLLHTDLHGDANELWEQPYEQEAVHDVYAIPSPDGRRLAMFGWTMNSNMWMLENF